MSDKIIVLVQEDPSYPKFQDTCRVLGLQGIDPLDFIEPESHTLANIYADIFKDELANQLMGYLVHRQDTLLVYEVIGKIHDSKEQLVIVNATLLTEEDVRFMIETQKHVLTYNLEGEPIQNATTIYDASKKYKDEVGL